MLMAISLAHLEDPENATAAYDQVSWFYPVTLNTPDDCNIRFELFILIFFPPNLNAGGQLGQPGPCGAFELRGFPQQAGKGLDQEDYDVFGAGPTLNGKCHWKFPYFF